MGIRSYLIFDDVDSRDYGIEVFFQDVDHTPKRVYNRVKVAGRNGAVLIDEGRYEDVPVTYDCIALNDADRKSFVNALASKVGYYRLQDSFNSDEFYSAVFEGDVKPKLTIDREESTFSVSFTRYPQRWLTSGETIRPVFNGTVLTNPTLNDAGPLLLVKGYGAIAFNGYEINLENAVYGEVELFAGETVTNTLRSIRNSYSAEKIKVAGGDLISFGDSTWLTSLTTIQLTTTMKEVHVSDSDTAHFASSLNVTSGRSLVITTRISGLEDFAKGSEAVTWNNTVTITGQYRKAHAGYMPFSITINITVTATSSSITFERAYSTGDYNAFLLGRQSQTSTFGKVTAQSTMSALGNPTYIDCEIGESYSIEGGEYSSMNKYIALGSDLPTLASGDNEIAFDDTITELKVKPNWWKL